MAVIRTATISDIPAIENLLHASRLPTDDVKEHIANFFVVEEQGEIVGAGGLENCGEGIGLLRSFAVHAEYRNRGIAQQLYERILAHASQSDISFMCLLTTNAHGYFAKLGFASIARANAPEAIKNSQQFRESCPDSAVVMVRSVAAGCGVCTTTATDEMNNQ